MAIYSNSGFTTMSQDVKQLRVKIFDELSKIVDPEINTTITELELIDEVDISQESVKVDLHLTSPFCPAVFGFKICQDIHDNLLSIDGIDDVKVNVSNHFMAEQINNQVIIVQIHTKKNQQQTLMHQNQNQHRKKTSHVILKDSF